MIAVQVFFAAFLIGCFYRLAATDELLSSVEHARHEQFGKWNDLVVCPPGQYAYGFQLKIDMFDATDAVGVDEMALVCGDKKRKYPRHIYNTEGQWGEWYSVRQCPDEEFLVGFQITILRPFQAHTDLLFTDDEGVTDLRMFCSGGKMLEGGGLNDGTWMKEHRCKDDARICGISTYLMSAQGIDDDEGLTAVKMKCCDTAEKDTDITIG